MTMQIVKKWTDYFPETVDPTMPQKTDDPWFGYRIYYRQ
jgi:hypothetical protein